MKQKAKPFFTRELIVLVIVFIVGILEGYFMSDDLFWFNIIFQPVVFIVGYKMAGAKWQ